MVYPLSTMPMVCLSVPNSSLRYSGNSGITIMKEKNIMKFAANTLM